MIRRTCVLVVLALLTPACGGVTSLQASGPDTERLAIALPRDGGPINIFAGGVSDPLVELVYDKLLAPSPYVADPLPWLAERVEQVDPRTWDVQIRDGVTWHDGEPLTAEDVRFTFQYFVEAPTGRYTHHVSEVPEIADVALTGDRSLRFTCAYPCPELGPITFADLPIIPEHVWSGVAEPATRADLPIGSGPYRLVDYSPTSGYRFEANEAYFAGVPRVGELIMPVIPDPSTAFTALRSGEIDAVARPLPPELTDSLGTDERLGVITVAPLQFDELRLNYQRPPFDDPQVRRGLSLAIDRQALLDTVLLGQGRVALQGYPHPDSPWTNPNLSTPYDPDEARRLLAGREISFDIDVSGSEPTQVRAAELVAQQLAAVGVTATVRPTDAATIADLFRTRDFDAYVNTITAHGVADPTQFIMSHRSGYLWDAPELPYPERDALEARWRAQETIEDRTTVLFEMQELFNRQPTSIPLYYPDERWAFGPAYDGWAESPGHGIVHKWSFLPDDVRTQANAVVTRS
ncbi:MAG: ABC transporter substrate-binding protein [Egibacteraceae bacterium]